MGLASLSSYLTGNRVYNGGTNNPTSGTVNPFGYIQRELRKKQSSKRSGLAQTALRMQERQQHKSTSKPIAIVPPKPINPTVTSTETGRLVLQETPDPNAAGNVLPFDPQTAAQQLLLQKQNQDFNNDLVKQRQQLANSVTTQERDLDLQLPTALRNVLNNFAGRGMAYSSGYGTEYGNTQADFARQRADLERQLQEGMADYDAQQQQAANDYQLALAQLADSSAEGLSEDAGDLGLAPVVAPKIAKPVTKGLPKKATKKLVKKTNHKAAAKRIAAKKKKGKK